jgi:hypothetical protein
MTNVGSTTANVDKTSPSSAIPLELVVIGNKRFKELAATQKELLEKVQEVNRSWFDRMQSEANLASEFAAKLTAARSIPETTTVYQEWTSRCMPMAAEDAKHLFADGQKMMETGAHLLSNGWLSNGPWART